MKAIISNNVTFEITGERGDYFICKDSRGKLNMFAKQNVTVIEIDEMPKAKTYRKPSKSSYDYKIEKSLLMDMAQNNPYSLTTLSDHDNATDIVKSIVSQALCKMCISEKQAYVLAKFAESNSIKL